jgi:hypothetical protein
LGDRPGFWRLSVDTVWVQLDRLLLNLGSPLLSLGGWSLLILLLTLLWDLVHRGGLSGLFRVLAL